MKKLEKLKKYFEREENVLLAFLFGSRAKNYAKRKSDWDIGIYFKSDKYIEIDSDKEYPDEKRIWRDMEEILKAEVDLVVMNRAKPSLVFSILNKGVPIVIKDRKLFLRLLIRTHYEAADYFIFTKEFYKIRERAKSLSEEDKAVLREHLVFLENEFSDLPKFKSLKKEEYFEERDKRRNVEKWVENLVMCAIDISKIILAGEKKEIPETYRKTLYTFVKRFMDENSARRFSEFAWLRNIISHEYMDMKWKEISDFIKDAERLFPLFIENVKKLI